MKEPFSRTQKVYARPCSTVKHREFLAIFPSINFCLRPDWLSNKFMLKKFMLFSGPYKID